MLKYILIAVALLYLVLPRDLIPDAAGLLGRVDDAIVIAYLIRVYRLRKLAKKVQNEGSSADKSGQGDAGKERASPEGDYSRSTQAKEDPYSVLGITPQATPAEITAAYKQEAAKYHPDKVNHLGEELQKLAHQRMLAISEAYEQLRR